MSKKVLRRDLICQIGVVSWTRKVIMVPRIRQTGEGDESN